jgi:hypothetical protein
MAGRVETMLWLCMACVPLCAIASASCSSSSSANSTRLAPPPSQPTVVLEPPNSTLCPPRSEILPADPCALPEGTTCEVGLCAQRYAVCTAQRWVLGVPPNIVEACPLVTPRPSGLCPSCWSSISSCVYGCEGDSGVGVVATCATDGGWGFEPYGCRGTAFDAGAQDASDSGSDGAR